jgi:N-acylneuraminate cytidylyltransferase
MKIAVIPARGGSKRIPRKNIKPFRGKPMIAWSIEAAQRSGLFDHVVVSTDDSEISVVASQMGAECPFIRPADLADDQAATTAVIAHATKWAIDLGWPVDAVCCIYATAPFMRPEDIRRGWEMLESGDWAYVFSATDYPAPIFRSFRQRADGSVEMVYPEHFGTRSQDLPVVLHDAAQFYWGRPQAWLEGKRVFDLHSRVVVIPRWRVQDIDNVDDWIRAELLAEVMQGELRLPS